MLLSVPLGTSLLSAMGQSWLLRAAKSVPLRLSLLSSRQRSCLKPPVCTLTGSE